jgi:hypothetical protein
MVTRPREAEPSLEELYQIAWRNTFGSSKKQKNISSYHWMWLEYRESNDCGNKMVAQFAYIFRGEQLQAVSHDARRGAS